ncbi:MULTISPECIES: glycosyltransferase family 4 protein [unclassified Pantoea]|uniref:glycosyltransferase family 4 protein n=1 Tax=unclassified Pantoea TaxID=2630326 RepID=UPI0002FE9CAF|nr:MULTISPECIES: glycosyltransferase family 4 protein [unclassified Pantoea]QNQ59987.1 glycosyltransferase family 4 protein [Pantoea sp. MT58]
MYFVNTDWYFELHWLDRVSKLVNDGYDVHLITCFNDELVKKRLQYIGIHCWHIEIDRFSINPFSNVINLISFFKLFNKIKPDLIHTITIKPNIIGGMVARFKSIPQIISVVGLGRVFLRENLLKKVATLLYRIVIYKNKRVQLIFEHESDKRVLENMVVIDSCNLHVIDGAGIDVEKFPYTPEIQTESIKVLFASRLLKSKGLEILVESIRKLKAEGLDIILYVAGIVDEKDPDRISMQQIKEWQNEGLIEWLGTRNDVDALLKECNIMVLPTKYAEGIPRIILEACAIGRACIVGNMPGCRSIIENRVNGMILAEHSVNELSNSLSLLSSNPDLRKAYGIISSEKIKNKFSKEVIISKTVEVYNFAISNNLHD